MIRTSKSCSGCKRPAERSLNLLLSSLVLSPRIQRSSPSIPLCKRCIQELCDGAAAKTATKLREALKSAYTAIERALSDSTQRKDASDS